MDESQKKVKVNLIYSPQGCDGTEPRFANDQGELWMHGAYKEGWNNVGMSFYSCPGDYPNVAYPDMSIYVIEPRAVIGSERDYNLKYLDKFKYVFTWATKAFENTRISNKLIHLHHPSCLGIDENIYENRKKEWMSWQDRKNEIIFIANNKTSNHNSELYSLRLNLADWLHANLKEYQVAWYSQIPVNRPYYRGKIEGDKFDILKNVKFTVCTENCYDPIFSHNYFTEKLPEAWFGGAVPLYMGCYNINDFGFDKQSYIDLRKYVYKTSSYTQIKFDKLKDRIIRFDQNNYNELVKAIDYNIKERKLFDLISEYKVLEKMIKTFHDE